MPHNSPNPLRSRLLTLLDRCALYLLPLLILLCLLLSLSPSGTLPLN